MKLIVKFLISLFFLNCALPGSAKTVELCRQELRIVEDQFKTTLETISQANKRQPRGPNYFTLDLGRETYGGGDAKNLEGLSLLWLEMNYPAEMVNRTKFFFGSGLSMFAVTSLSENEPLLVEIDTDRKLSRARAQKTVEFISDASPDEFFNSKIFQIAVASFARKSNDYQIVVSFKRYGSITNLPTTLGFKDIVDPVITEDGKIARVVQARAHTVLNKIINRAPKDRPTQMLQRLDSQIPVSFFRWESEVVIDGKELDDALVTSSERAEKIVAAVFDNKDLIKKVEQGVLKQFKGGIESKQIWDFYLKHVYDKFAFSDEYQKVAQIADKGLPLTGQIIDLGAGGGALATYLAASARQRKFILVDRSETACAWAQDKLDLLFSLQGFTEQDGNPYQVACGDLSKLQEPGGETAFKTTEGAPWNKPFPQLIEGAVLKSILFLLPKELKVSLLNWVYHRLAPQGVAFIFDPILTPKMEQARASGDDSQYQKLVAGLWHRKRIQRTVQEAIKNGAPLTERDIVLGTFYQSRISATQNMMTAKELLALLKKIGFEIQLQKSAYYGQALVLTVTRP